jgi:hypothetical protein
MGLIGKLDANQRLGVTLDALQHHFTITQIHNFK